MKKLGFLALLFFLSAAIFAIALPVQADGTPPPDLSSLAMVTLAPAAIPAELQASFLSPREELTATDYVASLRSPASPSLNAILAALLLGSAVLYTAGYFQRAPWRFNTSPVGSQARRRRLSLKYQHPLPAEM